MKTTILHILLAVISAFSFQLHAQSSSGNLVTEAHLMANIKSFNSNGNIKCETICYLKAKQGDLPPMMFRITDEHTNEVVYEYQFDIEDAQSHGEIEIFKNEENIRISFGNLWVKKDYSAQLFLLSDYQTSVYHLGYIGYDNKATQM